jgi:hypothetical protein
VATIASATIALAANASPKQWMVVSRLRLAVVTGADPFTGEA